MTGGAPDGEQQRGQFWLAGALDEKVSGGLTLGPEGALLQLDQAVTSPFRTTVENVGGGVTRTSFSFRDQVEQLTVHGELAAGPVSMVDGHGTRWGPHGQTVRAGYALVGAHVDRDQRFTGLRARFRHLDDWAALPGFQQTLEFEEATGRPLRAGVTFERPELPEVELAGGGRLVLEQVVGASTSEGFDGGRVTRAVWLCVLDAPPATWRELDRGRLTPLSTLLTLAADTDCPPLEVQLRTADSPGWLPLHSSFLRPAAGKPRRAGEMLAPLPVLGLKRVATWLDRVEDLGPLPPVVASAAAGPPRTVETGVLELATTAEGLARRLWQGWQRLTDEQAAQAQEVALAAVADQGEEVASAVRGALTYLEEPSYPQRLERLAEHAGPAVPGVLGRLTETGRPTRWKEAVVGARIELAHRLDRGWLGEGDVERYATVHESLRWLLTGLLLLETGLPADDVAARLRGHERYGLFLRQARHWLPKVYDVPPKAQDK